MLNEMFSVVEQVSEAKAVANLISKNCVEIIFLTPVAHNCSRNESIRRAKEVGFKYHMSAGLPSFTSAYLINHAFVEDLITSCHLRRIAKGESPIYNWLAKMDHLGSIRPTETKEVMANVYASIKMNLQNFLEINPGVNFPDQYLVSYSPDWT